MEAPKDLLQNILFFNTPYGWSSQTSQAEALKLMLLHVLRCNQSLVSPTGNPVAVVAVDTSLRLQDNASTLYLLLHYMISEPNLWKLCLDGSTDALHAVSFLAALQDVIVWQHQKRRGVSGDKSLLPRSCRIHVEKEGAVAFVDMCRLLWIDTLTEKSRVAFSSPTAKIEKGKRLT